MKKIIKHLSITTLLSISALSQLSADNTVEPDIANGAKLWAQTCMRCHNLRAPDSLSKRAWEYSMNHMRIRAGLTGKETRDILAFILSSKTTDDGSRIIWK